MWEQRSFKRISGILKHINPVKQKIAVTLTLQGHRHRVSILGVAHYDQSAAPKATMTYGLHYCLGVQKALKPHHRAILVEGHLRSLLAPKTWIIPFSFQEIRHVVFDLDQTLTSVVPERIPSEDTSGLAPFSAQKDVFLNIKRHRADREFSLTHLQNFPTPNSPKPNRATYISIRMAVQFLDLFHQYPTEKRMKLLCGLYHQCQVAALLQDPKLLVAKMTACFQYFKHITPTSPSEFCTWDEVYDWILKTREGHEKPLF